MPGAVGLVFALLWYIADRNPPRYADAVAEETDRPALMTVLRNPVLWGLLLARFVSDPVWFFFQYWQAGYMQERLGASLADVGALLWLPPLITSALTFLTVGIIDRRIRNGWNAAGSRLRMMQVTIVLSPLIATLPFIGGVPWFLVVVTTSYLLGFTWLFLSNILMTDLFPKNSVGTAVGIVNCVGTGGAALFNLAAGPVIDNWGYMPVFLALACLHPIAAIVVQVFYRKQLAQRSQG